MKKEFKNLLVGLALGDGHITKNGRSLRIQHCAKQKGYLQYKIDLINSYLEIDKVKIHEFDNSGYPGVRMWYFNPFCKYIRRWLYKDGYKKIKKELLYRLTDREIAIWYMDDGCLYDSHKGTGHMQLKISTCCKTQAEALDLIEFMSHKYDAHFFIIKEKGKYSIGCGKQSAKKFLDKIKPFVIDSMSYKLLDHEKWNYVK